MYIYSLVEKLRTLLEIYKYYTSNEEILCKTGKVTLRPDFLTVIKLCQKKIVLIFWRLGGGGGERQFSFYFSAKAMNSDKTLNPKIKY
jgi:hypothetical protein